VKDHFVRLAAYNRWANGIVYDIAAGLTAEEFGRDLGAFFKSVKGTLNHLLVVDRVWLGRLTGEGAPGITGLDQILFEEFEPLRAARAAEDERIAAYVEALDPVALGETVTYRSLMGGSFQDRRVDILTHVFNHQAHHRGQAHALLTRLGRPSAEIDFLFFLRRG